QNKTTVPYHGMTNLKIEVEIMDSEDSENGNVLWTRIRLGVYPDAGPFAENGRYLETKCVWFGLQGGKQAQLQKNQIPLLLTTVKDFGKYEGGGIWDSIPADGKSFWVTKGWTKEMVPRGRWNDGN